MDEQRLENLVRMGLEAEAFERDLDGVGDARGAGVQVHRAGRDEGRRFGARGRRRVRAVAALALCLMFVGVVGAVLLTSAMGGGYRRGGQQASGTLSPRRGTGEQNKNQNMLIALYRADDAAAGEEHATCPECWCVKRWRPEWASGRDLASVREDEMIGASMEKACVNSPARMVVIGLSGPAEALPKSDDQAREVAMCILDKNAESGVQPVGCLASSVDVRVETWKR